jgi:hypothetical protein
LSSAILYLAIVAIWACVLVPRWLHRSHESPADLEASAEENLDLAETSDPEAQSDWAEPGTEAAEFTTPRDQDADYADPVAWENPSAPIGLTAPENGAEDAQTAACVQASAYTETTEYAEESSYSETFAYVEPAAYSETVTYSAAATHRGEPAEPAAHDDPAPEEHADAAPQRPHNPATSRARVLQARRRLLTMLVTLAVVTVGGILIGLLPAWIIFPPLAMIGLYLLLLREAAQADAEHAAWRAELQARAAHAARARAEDEARERARLAQAVPELAPTAEVIDISALAARSDRDQPYDQYADAEVRAVGD